MLVHNDFPRWSFWHIFFRPCSEVPTGSAGVTVVGAAPSSQLTTVSSRAKIDRESGTNRIQNEPVAEFGLGDIGDRSTATRTIPECRSECSETDRHTALRRNVEVDQIAYFEAFWRGMRFTTAFLEQGKGGSS